MPDYRLYCLPESGNSYKVALMLALCGADWEPVFVAFLEGATREPSWRAEISEMGEVPVLEQAGRRYSQSGVILTRLAERFGRFGGRDEEERYEVLRWLLFDNHKFTSYFATHRFMRCLTPTPPDPAVMEFLRSRIAASFGIVEKRLAETPYIVGPEPTIADISMMGYLFFSSQETGYDLEADYPNIAAWRERIRARRLERTLRIDAGAARPAVFLGLSAVRACRYSTSM